jgi:hypothetical protein
VSVAVLDIAEAAPVTTPTPSRARALWHLPPWLLPAAALVAALLHTGTPGRYVAIYFAYLALAVVLPGTLVFRGLLGSRGNLPADLGLGAATGLALLLAGWLACAATSRQALLPYWPALLVVPFLLVPGLRRRAWRIAAAERRPLPARWSWIMAPALVVIVAINFSIWTSTPLPPADASYYQDLMYHLALVHEMTRSIPFQVPQLTGDTLRYHYLSDADIAIASMITKIPPAVVLLRLWVVPIEALGVFVTAALGHRLTGKWWAGALAGVASVLALPLTLGEPTPVTGGTAIQEYSPSQTYVIPLLGMLIVLAVEVLAGRRLGWAWVLAGPLALACAGGKSSALPPFVAGLALAALVLAVLRRWRRLLATTAFLGLAVVAMFLGIRLFAGGGASSLALRPFAIVYWMAPYKETLGVYDALAQPAGADNATADGRWFLFWLVCWWALVESPRLLGLAAVTTRRTRGDPAAWLLAGMTAAGAGAMWMFWHPAASQLYFFLCVVPFGTVLTVWLLANHARSWRPVVAGLLAGAIYAYYAPAGALPAHHTMHEWAWALAQPLIRTAWIAAGVAVLGLIVWRLAAGRFAWGAVPVALIAAVLGAGFTARIEPQWRWTYQGLVHPQPVDHPDRAITADEARAALWLGVHAGNDDVIATNVHCLQLDWTAGCDARAFWVTGLAGRRTVVESWAYTDQAVLANGVNGESFVMQPAPYPDRFALNQRVFAKGDPADVARLRTEYHVRWLFADSRAQGGVSPRLSKVAKLRYQAGTASVYEL